MDSSSTSPKKKKGLGRLWTKFKLALKRRPETNSTTTTDPSNQTMSQQTPLSEPRVEHTQKTEAKSNPADKMESTKPEPLVEEPIDAATPIPEHTDHNESREMTAQPPVEATPFSDKEELTRRYERAQAIFRRYNLELDESGWEARPKAQVERVHKAPRIRVRWTCHECKTTFGHDKVCVECAHQRCRTCQRYPPKKKKAKAAKQAALAATMHEPSQDAKEGTCHECQTNFDLGAPECSNCHHVICERCLQESIATAEVEPQAVAST